jgi:hypothetical protein
MAKGGGDLRADDARRKIALTAVLGAAASQAILDVVQSVRAGTPLANT